MIGVSQRSGTIMAVSLRLLYLVFDKLLRWLALLGPTTSSKGIELLLLRHDDRAAACGPVDLTPATPSLPLRSVGTSIEEQGGYVHHNASRRTPRTCSARAHLFEPPDLTSLILDVKLAFPSK